MFPDCIKKQTNLIHKESFIGVPESYPEICFLGPSFKPRRRFASLSSSQTSRVSNNRRMFSVVTSPLSIISLRYFSDEAALLHPALSPVKVIYEILFTGRAAKTQQRDVIFTMSHFPTSVMTTRWHF